MGPILLPNAVILSDAPFSFPFFTPSKNLLGSPLESYWDATISGPDGM
jgi:hypothetical protein